MINKNHYQQILAEATQLCETDHLASSTIAGKIGCLSRLLKGIAKINAEEIKAWLESYISLRTGHPLGPHGKNAYIISFNWFLKRTTLFQSTDPIMKGLKRYKAEAKGKTMSLEMFESIVQFSPTTRHELAFRLIFECGFRPHELLSIRVCDLRVQQPLRNENNSTIVDKTKDIIPSIIIQIPAENPVTPSGRNKTGNRSVLVVDNAQDVLELAHQVDIEEGNLARLFPWKHKHLSVMFNRMKTELIGEWNEENSKISLCSPNSSSISCESPLNLRQGRTEAELPRIPFLGRLYDCRHTAITNMYLRKLPDQVIRRMVGWTPSSKMPDTYVHINEAHIISAFQTFKQIEPAHSR